MLVTIGRYRTKGSNIGRASGGPSEGIISCLIGNTNPLPHDNKRKALHMPVLSWQNS